MGISLSGLRDFNQQTSTPDVEGQSTTGWLLGRVTNEEDVQQTHGQPAIVDPKAARMFELYARHGTNFAWENLRSNLIRLRWLGHIQIEINLKRTFDLLVALSALPLVLPIMLFTALVIKLDSSGPVIFRQERVGKWGRRFTCYKFRSMYTGADARKTELMAANEADEVVFKMKRDPRVTRVGYFIRRFSIDELPQIFNVIRGDMSLVGPRPEQPTFVKQFRTLVPRYMDRHHEKAGLTGWAQVNGLRGDTSIYERTKYDLWYIENWSVWLDIKILIRTLFRFLFDRNAY